MAGGVGDCDYNLRLDACDILAGAADLDLDGVLDACQSIGAIACHGDAGCPCGNDGARGSGCGNSFQPHGADIVARGVPSISADTVELEARRLPPFGSVLFFQGQALLAPAPFGDGLRCAGGFVRRLDGLTVAAGRATCPVPGTAPISMLGAVQAGFTHHYQAWYRNAAGFCTPAAFNLTSVVSIQWQP